MPSGVEICIEGIINIVCLNCNEYMKEIANLKRCFKRFEYAILKAKPFECLLVNSAGTKSRLGQPGIATTLKAYLVPFSEVAHPSPTQHTGKKSKARAFRMSAEYRRR